MSGNRGVVYIGSGQVEGQKIDYPKMQDPRGRKIEHGVILKVISTNICGSDQHMVRGRTTAQGRQHGMSYPIRTTRRAKICHHSRTETLSRKT